MEPNSPVGQTSEERALKVREFVNRARYQDFKEIPMDQMGFEITKIDYTSFRRNFGSRSDSGIVADSNPRSRSRWDSGLSSGARLGSGSNSSSDFGSSSGSDYGSGPASGSSSRSDY